MTWVHAVLPDHGRGAAAACSLLMVNGVTPAVYRSLPVYPCNSGHSWCSRIVTAVHFRRPTTRLRTRLPRTVSNGSSGLGSTTICARLPLRRLRSHGAEVSGPLNLSRCLSLLSLAHVCLSHQSGLGSNTSTLQLDPELHYPGGRVDKRSSGNRGKGCVQGCRGLHSDLASAHGTAEGSRRGWAAQSMRTMRESVFR